jgi:ABC-type lipoprotein export system ATPase subunit
MRLAGTATSARSAVLLRGVKKAFPLGAGTSLPVLDIEEFALRHGTCAAIRGRSGSGKTTLLNLVAGVTLPTAGTVCVDETDIFALSEPRRDRFRAEHVGYVFQTFNLLSAFSALDNVVLAMAFAKAVPRSQQRGRATALLARLGLAARLNHRPHHLSRGEQQRVAIARALANGPPLILADEPCASLDGNTAGDVMAMFLVLCREERKTLLLVTHDDSALASADQVLDMSQLNRAAAVSSAE